MGGGGAGVGGGMLGSDSLAWCFSVLASLGAVLQGLGSLVALASAALPANCPAPLRRGVVGGVLQAALGVCRAAMERGKREAPTSGGVRASVRAWRDLTVPQRFFRHFYVIGVGSFLGAFLLARGAAAAPTVLCLALLAVHTARRLAETVFVQIFSPDARMHVVAYAFGLLYYVTLPFSFLSREEVAAVVEGAGAGVGSGNRGWPPGAAARVCAGVALYAWSSFEQSVAHWQLAALRRGGSGGGGSRARQYFIPKGRFFELVSCPHYLFEIGLYVGLKIVQGSAAADGRMALLMLWVVSNLLAAALTSHRWYHARFKTYPRARKALIPYVL